VINLILPEDKKQLRAARGNVVLRSYFMLLGLAVLLMGAVFGFGLFMTSTQKAEAESSKAASEQASLAYKVTRDQAAAFTKDLSIAKTILASDVRFSTLITNIAAIVPPNVILSNLSLGSNNLTAPLTLSGKASSYDNVVRFKNDLEASDIFENVKILDATNADVSGQNVDPVTARYPVTFNISTQFSQSKEAK
jgi:Tfp pilus assembly protein PilN